MISVLEAVDRLGRGAAVGMADAADRWLDAGLGKTLSVLDRNVWRLTI